MSTWINNDSFSAPSNALVDIQFIDGDVVTGVPPTRYSWSSDAPVQIKAWRHYFPDESRIDIIAQNGNDGGHYEDDGIHIQSQVDTKNNSIPNLMTGPKPPTHKTDYYVDETGEDWIDECARTMTPDEFRGAMKFVIGKYLRRIGKKDNVEQELTKVADYTNRWLQYESNLTK